MAILARILAPHLHGAEMVDAGQPVLLPPEEALLVEKSVAKRRREFALGRACARMALEGLGHGNAGIGRRANGAPHWPDGVAGSITHTQGYAAALVGEAWRFCGIGLDAERIGGVTYDLWPRLFGPREREYLEALDGAAQEAAATLIFSAKEACYKAWNDEKPLAFHDMHIRPQTGGFSAVRAGETLQGVYAMEGDLMVTAAWF